MRCLAATGNRPMEPRGACIGPLHADPAWIDHNGHVNLPFYTVMFICAVTDVMNRYGLGEPYTARGDGSFFGVENHVRYLRELRAGDSVLVDVRLLDHDAKRLHWYAAMSRANGGADDGTRVASFELLSLHVDQRTRKVAPMPACVMRRVEAIRERDRVAGIPSDAGRVGIAR
ncbi:thioesterase family protein [Paraburkholderia caballeronis]|uniref:thioesterase family protein n=2 Tax=Paraburkholderia caballeronis TaxID=416943 RepID=UPI003132B24F